MCRAHLGEHSAAVDALRGFLATWQRAKGPSDERTLSVWQQIAVLLVSTRRYDEARAVLAALRYELTRVAGAGSGAVAAVEEQIGRIDRYRRP